MNLRSRFFSISVISISLLFFSCVSTPSTNSSSSSKKTEWKRVTSISELKGTWNLCFFSDEETEITYPFVIKKADGTRAPFMKFSEEKSDDTPSWQRKASELGISLEELWQKRFSYLGEIYDKKSVIQADENGCEAGTKLFLENGRIFSQKTLLVPEKIVLQNLSCFQISSDGKKISRNQNIDFKFYSHFDNGPSEKKLSSEIGLVLSGGGGKGAYEVGVWKALLEYGIAPKITCISGTSVGGLNSALFAVTDYNIIEEIWKNQVPYELTRDDDLISQKGLKNIIAQVQLEKFKEMIYPKVFVTALRNKNLLLKIISSKPGRYAARFLLNEETDINEIGMKLLATSAFPVITSPIVLKDGNEYIDGGAEQFGGDNTPVDPVVDSSPLIKDIIVVYLSSNPPRRIRKIDYDSKNIIEIIPSIDLGNLLEGTANFGSSRINLLINQGYSDAVKILRDDFKLRPKSPFWFD